MSYFDRLATALRERGMPADAATATVADLVAHTEDAGTDPESEFGPATTFADLLTGGDVVDGPPPASDPTAQTWTWTADAFQDRERLNAFGDEGWEVQEIDAAGRFVSTRDLESPQRWEYRRETVLVGRSHRTERLAPDGWEPCGTWMVYTYYKRPKAASLGPEAALAALPEHPRRRLFWGKRFYAFLAAYAVLLTSLAIYLFAVDRDSDNGFVGGLITGAAAGTVIAVIATAVTLIRTRRRTGQTP